MGRSKRRARDLVVTLGAAAAVSAAAAPSALATAVRFERLTGYPAAGTPAKFNKVGVLETGPRSARNVLILVPGTSASAAYFEPLAKTIVRERKGWQVWAVERRENLLEDQSVVDRVKAGRATTRRLFDYYLGYLTDPSVKSHYQPVPDASVPFARQWGMKVAVQDLRRVVRAAKRRGGNVVLGGHSLGGTITTAYATWDFNGKAGAKDLSGLVFIDGGSSTTPVTAEQATQSLQDLEGSSPWLAFGGIPAPFAGLFNVVGATTVRKEPNRPSVLQSWSLLPADLKPPVAATNVAAYGYALDTETSPAGLAAAQAHMGRLASSGDPRVWVRAGELSPILRVADAFSGTGLKGLDGTAWYHPRRLTIDAGAVGNGLKNPAQDVLDVHATHGGDLPKSLRLYAFAAALGSTRVLDATKALAKQSGISSGHVTLVDRHTTYAHNDPNSAAPAHNVFLKRLIPFLGRVARG
jgi:pimeloyl-ACP methyl ester carboxylesterase